MAGEHLKLGGWEQRRGPSVSPSATSELAAALAGALPTQVWDMCTGSESEFSLGKSAKTTPKGKITMNIDQLEGKWKQYKGQIREKWGHLTDDDLQTIAGKRDKLIGRIQERYGIAKERATEQVDAFLSALPNHPAENSTTEERSDRAKTHTAGQR